MTEPQDVAVADPLDTERARLFALLARLLGAAPDAALLARLKLLPPGPGEVGEGLALLSAAAARTTPEQAEREFFELFIGVGRGELLPYASYYLTGFLHERPLAELRADLARIGVERAEGIAEPEDHIAFLCEVMAGLILHAFAGPPDEAAPFFTRHLRPWAARFFADLEAAQAATFYRAVGRLGRLAMELEAAAADLPA